MIEDFTVRMGRQSSWGMLVGVAVVALVHAQESTGSYAEMYGQPMWSPPSSEDTVQQSQPSGSYQEMYGQPLWEPPYVDTGASANDDNNYAYQMAESSLPDWAEDAKYQGYYGPDGWVEPIPRPDGSYPSGDAGGSSGGGGASKGTIIGLSVAGAVVGLTALFTAGVLIRRNIRTASSQRAPKASRASKHSYRRVNKAEPESALSDTELNPLTESGKQPEDVRGALFEKSGSKGGKGKVAPK